MTDCKGVPAGQAHSSPPIHVKGDRGAGDGRTRLECSHGLLQGTETLRYEPERTRPKSQLRNFSGSVSSIPIRLRTASPTRDSPTIASTINISL